MVGCDQEVGQEDTYTCNQGDYTANNGEVLTIKILHKIHLAMLCGVITQAQFKLIFGLSCNFTYS